MGIILLQLFIFTLIFLRKDLQVLNPRNYLIVSTGKELQRFLSRAKGSSETSSDSIPQYKFYTDLTRLLLDLKRLYGVQIQKRVIEIREVLAFDIEFEIKILSELKGGIIQLGFICGMILCLFFVSQRVIESTSNSFILITSITIQLGGLSSFIILFLYLKRRIFKPYSQLFESIIIFRCLVSAGMDVKQVIQLSKLDLLGEDKKSSKELKLLRDDLILSSRRWSEFGEPVSEELDLLFKELVFLQKFESDKFIKKVEVLKFLVLALFGLPAFITILAGLFANQISL